MFFNRRKFLKKTSGILFLLLNNPAELLANNSRINSDKRSLINVIIPRDYPIPIGPAYQNYQYQLIKATLDLLKEKYSNRPLPIWKKTFAEVDLQKRLVNIVHWIIKAVEAHQNIYPMDPAWIIAQIMKESYFNEFAVSSALAAGICQFIRPTAQAYNMVCAGDEKFHHRDPYKFPEFANKVDEYYRLRKARKKFRRSGKPRNVFTLPRALKIIHSGEAGKYKTAAGNYLTYLDKLRGYDQKVIQARKDFKKYLQENVQGKDLFRRADLEYLLKFDERFTYKKPIFSMVKMLTKALKARNGNILAATISYNAGLYSTLARGMYKPYGKIPAIQESTTYLSHILVNYHEITQRMSL